jgi:hypothetical protein
MINARESILMAIFFGTMFAAGCDNAQKAQSGKAPTSRAENDSVAPMTGPIASDVPAKFELASSKEEKEIPVGQIRPFEIRLKNGSSVSVTSKGQADKKFAVFVSYHWLTEKGEMFIWDNIRSPLPGELKPGQEVTVPVNVGAPKDSGTYILEMDVVQEGVTWFRDKGMKPLHYKITVR